MPPGLTMDEALIVPDFVSCDQAAIENDARLRDRGLVIHRLDLFGARHMAAHIEKFAPVVLHSLTLCPHRETGDDPRQINVIKNTYVFVAGRHRPTPAGAVG